MNIKRWRHKDVGGKKLLSLKESHLSYNVEHRQNVYANVTLESYAREKFVLFPHWIIIPQIKFWTQVQHLV